MGHRHGSTYERYYQPDLIERDFQSIYFGTPSQDLLIESVARMGLSRDKRAPTDLTNDQKYEVKNHPELVKLREKRDRYKSKKKSKGTGFFKTYNSINCKINSLSKKLRRERLNQAVRDFHGSIDTIEINKQLDGIIPADILTQSIFQYELGERATIVKLLSQPLDGLDEGSALKIRTKFIRNLSKLCQRQESRWYAASSQKELSLSRFEDGEAEEGALGGKRKLSETGDNDIRKKSRFLKAAFDAENVQEPKDNAQTSLVQDDSVEIIHNPYPMEFTDMVCLICIGNEQSSYAERMRKYKRKYTLQKHLNTHIEQGVFSKAFECKHAYCSEQIQGITNFKNHAAFVHKVFH
jgi:hypothetical protein